MNSNVEILDDIDKVTMAARNDLNQKNLKNIFFCQIELAEILNCWLSPHVGPKIPVRFLLCMIKMEYFFCYMVT